MSGSLRDRAGFEELAARIRRGDASAEEEVVRLFASRIVAIANPRLHSSEDVKELASDVLMTVLLALRRGAVRKPGSLPAFVHGTTLRLVQNRRRRLARGPRSQEIPEDWEGTDLLTSLERADMARACRRAIHKLPETDRQILLLTLVEGLKPGEIASRLGLCTTVVRQRKCRAIKHLLEEVRGWSRSIPTNPV